MHVCINNRDWLNFTTARHIPLYIVSYCSLPGYGYISIFLAFLCDILLACWPIYLSTLPVYWPQYFMCLIHIWWSLWPYQESELDYSLATTILVLSVIYSEWCRSAKCYPILPMGYFIIRQQYIHVFVPDLQVGCIDFPTMMWYQDNGHSSNPLEPFLSILHRMILCSYSHHGWAYSKNI